MCVMSLNECKRNEEKFFSPRRAPLGQMVEFSHNSAPKKKEIVATSPDGERERG